MATSEVGGTAQGVELNVLGPWEVRVGQKHVAIPSGRLQTLLAALVLSEGRPVAVRTLADQLWPDEPPLNAGATVHTYVTRLRKLVGAEVIHTVAGGYQLRVETGHIDLYRFRGLMRATEQAGTDEQELELLQRALLLWRGRPFGDSVSTWLDREVIPPLTEEWFAATERRIDLEVAVGPPKRVIAELSDLTVRYPTRESLWVRLISALHGAGRRGEALEAYRQIRETLNSELGLDPSEELRHLQRAVLRDELPSHSSEPAVTTTTPAQLPADVIDFAGRTDELAALSALAQAAEGSTVTVLTGTAGVGKTALAVRWAHQMADGYPDGQLYVNLRGHAPDRPVRPIEALAWFIGALGVAPDRVPPDIDAAASLFRSLVSGRRMLILLDNVGDAEQVRPLLPAGVGMHVLVTSRRLLAGLIVTNAARHLTVTPLPADEAALFVTRILAPRLVSADSARALARQCCYLPLALRIAAANLRVDPHLGIDEYLDQLRVGDQLATLMVDGDPSASVRAALDWSYLRLPAPAQNVIRHLGLVPGPEVTVAAVAVLTDTSPEDAGRWMRALIDANLVEVDRNHRFGMHDLLKAYAVERGLIEDGDGDRAAAVSRLLDWYLRRTVAAVEKLYPMMVRLPVPPPRCDRPSAPPVDSTDALSWLAVERRNLVDAVVHAAANGHHEYAWRLGDALRAYFDGTGHRVDWLTVAAATMAAATAGGHAGARAAAAANLAHVHQFCGDGAAALDHATASLRFSKEAGWAEGEARALNHLGALRMIEGRPERAFEMFVDALALDRRVGDDKGVAIRLGNLGVTSMVLGRLDAAAAYLGEALEVHRRCGHSQALALANLATVQRMSGAYDAALRNALLSRTKADHGHPHQEVLILVTLCAIERDRGRLTEAQRYADLAEACAREVGAPALLADAAGSQGAIDLQEARYESAAERYRQAAEDTGGMGGRIVAQIGLTRALCGGGDINRAATCGREALEAAEANGYRILEADALFATAEVALERHRRTGDQGLLRDSLGAAERALTLYTAIGYRINEASTWMLLGDIAAAAGTPAVAARHRDAGLRLARPLRVPETVLYRRPVHENVP